MTRPASGTPLGHEPGYRLPMTGTQEPTSTAEALAFFSMMVVE